MSTTAQKRARSPHQPVGRWITKTRKLAIHLRDGFLCLYCLRDMHDADPRDLTLDHLICRADGGGNESSNLVTGCRTCNSSRGDKPLARFASREQRAHIRRNTRRSMARYLKLAKAIIAGETGEEAK